MEKTYWLVTNQNLEPFHNGIEEFCKAHLPQSVPQPDDMSYKMFADPIEGYVHLTACEVALVDTHLFQRLRGIRQLGLASLVYPTLGYCRFQHSLGVLARLKQVISQLEENHLLRSGSKGSGEIISERNRTIVRLAALCHDVGHCIFSHVSESIIEKIPGHASYPSASDIIKAYANYTGRPSIPISEVFSAAIITSRSFVRFIHALGVPHANRIENAAELARDVARLILGLPATKDPQSLFLGQLMNSGLDVDKLDYMMRESHFSGISLGISLHWLLKKLQVLDVPAEELPEDLKLRVRDFPANDKFRVLSVEKGGQFGFEEFSIARLTLHEKIYLHQKIRAAEAFVRSRLRQLFESTMNYNECHRWLYLKESQIEYPMVELPALPAVDLFSQNYRRDLRGLNLERIVSRDLLYRAFGFGWFNAIAEPLTQRITASEEGTDRLISALSENPDAFVSRIRENLKLMRNFLSDEDCPLGEPEILIDLPRMSTLQQGHETLYIEHPSQLTVRWTMPIDKIVEYYQKHRALAYIFTERKFGPCVLLAAEKAAWDNFRVLYVQEAAINTSIVNKAKALKSRLHEAGFYADARPLQPISDSLSSVYPQTLVNRIAIKLAHYEPRTKRLVTPSSVTTYVSQFPLDLQEAALEWLQHLEWIDPSPGIRRAVKRIIQDRRFESDQRIAICPLGATSDSATRIAYDLRDIGGDHPNKSLQLIPTSEALARHFDAYIFYDDNTNTGLQALNIIASWLNKTIHGKYKLKEEHVEPLEPILQTELLSKPIALAFAVGSEGAEERITQLITEQVDLNTANGVAPN